MFMIIDLIGEGGLILDTLFLYLRYFFNQKNEININKNNLSIFFKNFSIKYNRIFYIIFFIYVFTWNMKAIMTDDIDHFLIIE